MALYELVVDDRFVGAVTVLMLRSHTSGIPPPSPVSPYVVNPDSGKILLSFTVIVREGFSVSTVLIRHLIRPSAIPVLVGAGMLIPTGIVFRVEFAVELCVLLIDLRRTSSIASKHIFTVNTSDIYWS